MARLLYNGLNTTLGGSGLTSSATSVTFSAALTHSGGTNVPTISGSDYIPLSILDSTGKLSEIVYLTAYTSGATTGTIARGKESTTGVAHSSGDKVSNSATVFGEFSFHGARVYATASQAPTNATWTAVNFTNESFDSDGYHDNSTNPQRFTVPTGLGGKYLLQCTVSFAASGTGTRHVSLMVNATTRLNVSTMAAAGASFRSRPTSIGVIELAAGDFVHFESYQDAGSALQIGDTTTGGSAGETWAAITYLGT